MFRLLTTAQEARSFIVRGPFRVEHDQVLLKVSPPLCAGFCLKEEKSDKPLQRKRL